MLLTCNSLMARAALVSSVLAMTVAAARPVTAQGDDPTGHRVTYVVTADQSVHVNIYYRDVDPPTWVDYSHDPYVFSPKAEVPLVPGRPWVRDVMLTDPEQWAMVAVAQGSTRSPGVMRCELAVDGIVVVTAAGSDGTLCSLRHW